MADRLLLILFLVSYLFVSGVTSRNITIENKCNYTIWPGILSGGLGPPTGGFALKKGEARVINVPSGWSGRFWGRSLCSTNSTGGFSCATGDCGSGKVECTGGGTPPVTLAEFTIDSNGGQDFYDVSLVDGYNLPMVVVPQGDETCSTVGCVNDLNPTCPDELRVRGNTSLMTLATPIIACTSPCEAFNSSEYCCTGAYSTPQTCVPTDYSRVFKRACPRAYSYAYDDSNSTFTCASQPNYVITFCPSSALNTTK
ncbi:unnamed protein product [Thlaspi arvense]|uniref:Thaumatin-like protein n=1 Tax=Thlaspi arvense TaxID=13288 RepID=A0AAU9T8U1_THLAR|nr:unnamed protein product [Thlaspi arvense]